MIIYPAIDLRGGKCVRLYQGDPSQETVYDDDPVAMALKWQDLGAKWLHIVDLDGAFEGRPIQHRLIARIVASLQIPVQVGGGIRKTDDIARYLDVGIARVIVGTMALEAPEWFQKVCMQYPGRVAIGIDARSGYIAVRGWKDTTHRKIEDTVETWNDLPISALIYTDIGRDGTQRGVNIDATEALLRITHHPVIASGGVATIKDIRALLPLVKLGLNGVIIGRALYTGALDLSEALNLETK